MKQILVFILIVLLVDNSSLAIESGEQEENLDPVYFLALDGNMQAAMELLKSIDSKVLSPTELATRKKFLERFDQEVLPVHPTGTTLVEELIAIYKSYWDRVLLQKLSQEQGYHYLFQELTPVVRRLGGEPGEFSEVEYQRITDYLSQKLKETGIFSKFGGVRPHLNFMAWRHEAIQSYKVDLGTGEIQDVDVILMTDFIALGWAAYATFDKMHVGGWVGTNALHCVASSYDLDSENFRVSFLAHEARHFADKIEFPELDSINLEYRAKLNELFLANESFEDLLKKFLLEQRENPGNPHSYASFLLVRDLSKKLQSTLSLESLHLVSREVIQRFARELLEEHTEGLRRRSVNAA